MVATHVYTRRACYLASLKKCVVLWKRRIRTMESPLPNQSALIVQALYSSQATKAPDRPKDKFSFECVRAW